MKYPHISKKDVEETVNFYNEHPEIESLTPTLMGRTVEQFVQNIEKRAIKNNKKLIRSLVVYRENKDLLTPESIEVVNKILGDKKIRDKIKIVYDGSYLVNRIVSMEHINNNKLSMSIEPQFHGYTIDIDSSDFYKLPPKKEIDFLYNHFDVIYVQIRFVKNRSDIIEEILYHKREEMLYDMYGDIDY